MKYIIDKSFDFCYGHRVWSQELNTEFTHNNNDCLACRHLHGHQGKVKIFLETTTLSSGMVTDFKHLGWFKNFLDDVLDHKFIMDTNDPLIIHEVPELCTDSKFDKTKCHYLKEKFYIPNLNHIQHLPKAVFEKYEGMVFVDFVPTSENLTSWLLSIAKYKMEKLDVNVIAVEYWETPKSHCRVEVS
jgi:6-pyruvoyltetrahydropterin/6-carboxytetrahydropterin synthase